MLLTSAYTPASPIVDGSSNFIEGADVNNLLTPVTTQLQSFDDLKAVLFTAISGTINYNVTANSEILIYVDATFGDCTVTLPLASQQTVSSIKIKKIDNSLNKVSVMRSSTNVIENITTTSSVPTETTFVLNILNEYVELYPNVGTTSQWRVIDFYQNRQLTYVQLSHSGSQSISANTLTKVSFDTRTIDPLNLWNTANNEYTVPATGKYLIQGVIDNGASSNETINVYVNNANVFAYTQIWVSATEVLNFTFFADLVKNQVIDIRRTGISSNIFYSRDLKISRLY
jgi:hypothetical protein